jgi:Protein of unknown function (DUF664)
MRRIVRLVTVPDRKPPKFRADERETLLRLLQFQRESLVRKIEGVSDEDARRRFVSSATTLLWLVKHVRHAEMLWFCVRFAADGSEVPDDAVLAGDTVAAVVADYRAVWPRSDAIVLGASSLDEVCFGPGAGDPPVNLRWVLAHLLEETARHAGHADVLRELLDGSVGR